MLVALVCCLMMLTVEAKGTENVPAIQVDWDLAAIFMVLMMILGGLVIYEVARWGVIELYYQVLPGATTRRMKRLQRLRTATTQAIERELERLGSISQPSTTTATTTSSSRAPTSPHQEELQTRQHQPSSSISGRDGERMSTPVRRRSSAYHQDYYQDELRPQNFTPPRLPSIQVPVTPEENDAPTREEEHIAPDEAARVCVDTIMLMRLEEIREGLRLNGLMLSGVKADAAARLAEVIRAQLGTGSGPTLRQMKYLLWLWRERNLSGRTLLSWSCLRSRGDASRTIARWKGL